MALNPVAQYWGRGQRILTARRPDQLLLSQRIAWAFIGVGMALYAALEFWLTRGTTMFVDEYTMFVQDRGLHPSALVAPFNEHLELARRLLYAVGFQVLGAGGAFLAARFVEAMCVIVLAAVVFVFLKKRIGPAASLAPALLLLFFGSAWELDFAISGIGNVLALAAGTGALMTLERHGRRADAAACVLLVVSVVSFTTGVAFAIGALCLCAVRRQLRARAWVALVPLVVYAGWLLWVRIVYLPAHPGVQPIAVSNLLLIPSMIAQQGAATAGALTGLNYDFGTSDPLSVFSTSSAYGPLIAAAAGGLLALRLRRGASPLLYALLATLVVYWIELAIGYGLGRTPTTVRYVYAAGVIAILIAGEAVNKRVTSPRALAILYAVSALALVGNVARLRDGMHLYRTFGTRMRAQLSAIEIAAPSEQASFGTLLGYPPLVVGTAGPYLQAVDRNGSPAYSGQQLRGESEDLRAAADDVLVSALQLHLSASSLGQPASGCRLLTPAPRGSMTFALASPGVELRSSANAQVAVSRFASTQTIPIGTLAFDRAVDLRIPRDRSSLPWHVTISPAPATLSACGL